ncbi:AMP-binding protein [[Clostridium] polysaccharolyticum]|uniref:Long-chain acyl-CoA synthetase n=1 Tax=[Clostridium] polysaccharolyticum TaxID=29364 RepID=A0A1I0AFU2_9FIRM|nr:AMP-binding protein [[Clostridium] polysaccharolyticum]SES92558.1 long-chain acyl-CoA synthetase [[Clostridium] polysaccharolyticum]
MKSLNQYICDHALSQPKKTALIHKDEQLSYSQLVEKVREVSAYLLQLGMKEKDKVLLSALAKPEYIICFLAVQNIGGITVPVDRTVKGDSIQYLADTTGAKFFFTSSKRNYQKVEVIDYQKMMEESSQNKQETAIWEQMHSTDNISEILFTSGSTGTPKGVMFSEKGMASNTWNTINGIGMKEEDVILLSLPLSHSFGLRVMRASLVIGATIVLQNGSSYGKETVRNIMEHSCTGYACVTASMKMMLEQIGEADLAKTLGKLRYIEFSAGAVSFQDREYFSNLLPDTELHNTWGSTETGGCFFLNFSKQKDKLKSMGKPLDTVKAKIMDKDGMKELEGYGIEVSGKLAIQGEMQMAGYWGNKELTKETIKGGYLVTNDLVWRDQDGFFYMIGRGDDMINVGGEKVSPIEIEEAVLKLPFVRECACVGVEDPLRKLGEVPAVFVCNERSETKAVPKEWKEEIEKKLREQLDPYKIPQQIIEMELLPRNKMGKIERSILKENWNRQNQKSNQSPVIANILNRRSIRKFSDKEITMDTVKLLIECGKSAPSGKNLHTRRFTVIQSSEEIQHLKQVIEETGKQKNKTVNGFYNPKVLILVSDDVRNQDGIQDVACAVENILLGAASLGLGGVWLNVLMDMCDEKAIRDMLAFYKIPKKHWVWAMIAIGYPSEEDTFTTRKEDVVVYI